MGFRHEAAQAVGIVAFSTGAAIVYGVLHDQVTAHLCVEYFTIAHPPVFPTESPFLLALGWGVIATWWVGLPLGLGLAAAARLGPAPRLDLPAHGRPRSTPSPRFSLRRRALRAGGPSGRPEFGAIVRAC